MGEKAKVGFIEQRTPDGKVTPEVLQTILLDEISGRLGDVSGLLESSELKLIDIYDWLKATEQSGEIRSYPVTLIGEEARSVKDTHPWFECTIFSDGPASIKVSRSKTGLAQSVRYRPGDQLTIKTTHGSKGSVWVQGTDASKNAAARVVFKR